MSEQSHGRSSLWGTFTLYDIFGYVVPGVSLFLALAVTRYACDLWSILMSSGRGYDSLKGMLGSLAEHWAIWLVLAVVVSYLTGHVLSSISSMVIEKWVLREWLGYPTRNMIRVYPSSADGTQTPAESKKKRHDKFLSIVLGYRGSMGRDTVPVFRSQFERVFGSSIIERDTFNVFPLCFAWVKESCPTTYERVIHYVYSYGFARNTCCAFVVAAFAGLSVPVAFLDRIGFAVAWLILAFFFFRQYLKFFRRINDEVFFQFMAMQTKASGGFVSSMESDHSPLTKST